MIASAIPYSSKVELFIEVDEKLIIEFAKGTQLL
jgi:hypothetical protein